MTIAEQMDRQGHARGLAEGLAKALRKQLAIKFGPIDAAHVARIEAATSDQLDRYLERVLTADTLAAVFAAES